MAFTATLHENLALSGETLTASNSYSGNSSGPSIDEAIPDSSTDLLITFALDQSAMTLIYILSDQVLTLETNNSSAPTDTLVLVAGEPYIWHTGSLFTNLITADITVLYATNASGSTANLKIRVLTDPTP